MSKKQKMTQKNFKYTPKLTLPKLRKLKTSWDLKNLYYTSEKDPQIEKDIVATERAYKAFAKKYRGKDFISTSSALLKALQDSNKLVEMAASRKPSYYFSYRTVLNANDTVAQKRLSLIDDRLTKAVNEIIFFGIEISHIPKTLQKRYLADASLQKYHYDLKQTFDNAKHLLSEAEERILNLKSDVSRGMWIAGTDKILSKRSVTYKGTKLPLNTAINHINTVPTKERPKLWKLCTDQLADLAEIAENEINAVVVNKKINDELRGYKTPYEATIKGYENNEKSVLALVEAISTKGFALSRKYYKLKAKQAGVKVLPYANRADNIGIGVVVPYEDAVALCRDTFYSMKDIYGEIFDTMLQNGQIDTYPKDGKTGGAFCSHSTNSPTLVMLNQVDDTNSFTTLAHEMGHAIHSERSKIQPSHYEDYSTVTAETASTLFEGIAQERLIAELPDSQKLNMLNQRIAGAVATICRQVAFFNFEKELHETIRNEGAMTWQEMAKLFQKHVKAYMGPAVEVTETDGLSFVYVGHFRNFFYVYSYAYGELMSNIMTQKYYDDPTFIEKIDQFLCMGGSDTVENIFKSIGINANKTETFLESLKSLEADIKEFEKLIK